MCARTDIRHGTEQRLEVADILRAHGEAYRQRHHLSGGQLGVMRDLEACRTATLGGHLVQCDACGALGVRYHSCRNRHCPKCQTLAKVKWVEARQQELLPVPYFHCVFTLPHRLNALAQRNPRPLYGLLFQSASETLQTFGRDAKWLGGELGITMVLHTWSQVLDHHIHVHAVVTGGALAPEQDRWIATQRRDFLFPVKALSKVFRGKYRLVALQDGRVSFQWRDSRHGNKLDVRTLEAEEFIRRFLLHVLPRGLMRIRHYGVLGNRCRKGQLSACRALLDQPEPVPRPTESGAVWMRRLTGMDIDHCPHCHKVLSNRFSMLHRTPLGSFAFQA